MTHPKLLCTPEDTAGVLRGLFLSCLAFALSCDEGASEETDRLERGARPPLEQQRPPQARDAASGRDMPRALEADEGAPAGGSADGGRADRGSASTDQGGAGEGERYQPDNGPSHEGGQLVPVRTAEELLRAIDQARPGEVITLSAGEYQLNQLIPIRSDGTRAAPIFLRAAERGRATLRLRHIENFKLYGKFWIFENLRIIGDCARGVGCEHAFHIVGDADDLIFRGNEIVDFASHVKLNGERLGEGPAQSFPDRVWFINNRFYNTKYIENAAPHNILNLDGGRDHIVRGNLFADYNPPASLARSASAVYPKASTLGILIEQNLIVCERQRTEGETARGIQLGDGAPDSICDGDADQDGLGDCTERGQSQEAIVRNNLIIGCNNGGSSAGMMVDSDRASWIGHNTVYQGGARSAVFYIGHPDHDTFFRGNLLESGFELGAARRPLSSVDDLTLNPEDFRALFVDPSSGDFQLDASREPLELIPREERARYDFCGVLRGALTYPGAIDYGSEESAACITRLQMMYNQLP